MSLRDIYSNRLVDGAKIDALPAAPTSADALKSLRVNSGGTAIEYVIGGSGTGTRSFTAVVGFSDADYIVDGTADDVQIQQAATALSSGGSIFLQNGDYDITTGTEIELGDNQSIIGSGFSTKLYQSGTGSYESNGILTLSGKSGVEIGNLYLQGNQVDTQGDPKSGNGILIGGDSGAGVWSSDVNVSNVKFMDGYSGISISGSYTYSSFSKRINISDCIFHNHEHPISVVMGSDVNINNCQMTKMAVGARTGYIQRGIGIWDSYNINIDNIKVQDPSVTGLFIRSQNAGSIGTYNINVNNYTVDGSGYAGIYLEALILPVSKVSISNTKITNATGRVLGFNVSLDGYIKDVTIDNLYGETYLSTGYGIKHTGEYSTPTVYGSLTNINISNTTLKCEDIAIQLLNGENIKINGGYFSTDKVSSSSPTIDLQNITKLNLSNFTAVSSTSAYTAKLWNCDEVELDGLKLSNGLYIEADTTPLTSSVIRNLNSDVAAGRCINLAVSTDDYITDLVIDSSVVISSSNVGLAHSGVSSTPTTYGAIKNLTVTDSNITGYSRGVSILKGTNLIIKNCHFTATQVDSAARGGFFQNITGITLIDCTFEANVAGYDLQFYDCTDITMVRCNLTNNRIVFSGTCTGTIDGVSIQETRTGAGAISPLIHTTWIVSTGTDALTLADGVEGATKTIVMKTDGGDATITPTNAGNFTSLIFSDVGDTVELEFTNGKWYIVGGNLLSRVKLSAGTTAAGTAPLKFTPGALMTAPEDLALETDATDLYWTNGDGVRQPLSTNTFVGISVFTPITSADISIDYTSRVLTITPPLGYFDFYVDGGGTITKYRKTGAVNFPAFTDTSGIWYFYFDSTGTATVSQTAWTDFASVVTVYRILWNASLSGSAKSVVENIETHLNTISDEDHTWKHTYGTIWKTGFNAVNNALSSGAPNADGRNSVLAVTTGTNIDDNLPYTITNSTAGTDWTQDMGNTTAGSLNATNSGLFKVRSQDGGGLVSTLAATRFPFDWDSGTNIPNYITSTGTRTPVSNGYYFVYFVYSIQDPRTGDAVRIVSSASEYSTIAAARAATWTTVQGIYLTLNDKEIRPLYRLLFEYKSAYDAGCKYTALREVLDIRAAQVVQTSSAGSVAASSVTFVPAGTVAATNVQSAIEELDTEKVPTSRQLTINGTAYDLSADRSWTVSGFSWGASVTDTSGTGLTLAVGNSASASTYGQKITIGNTQTNAVVGLDINTGTSAVAHTGLNITVGNASTTAYGIKLTSGSGYTGNLLHIDNSAAAGSKGIYFPTFGINAIKYGIYFDSLSETVANTITYGIYFETLTNAVATSGRGIHFDQVGSSQAYDNWAIYIEDLRAGTANNSVGAYGLYIKNIFNASQLEVGRGGVGFYVANLNASGKAAYGVRAKFFSLNENSSSASMADRSIDISEILHARTSTRTSGTTTDSYNLFNIKDTSVQNGSGGTMAVSGNVLRLESVATQTAGTLTHTKNVLSLTQSATVTTGALIRGIVGSTERFTVCPMVANGASAVSYLFDTTTSLSTSGAKIASFGNAGTEKANIDKDGVITAETNKRVACGGGSTGAGTTANGTVTLEINGVSYYLLTSASA